MTRIDFQIFVTNMRTMKIYNEIILKFKSKHRTQKPKQNHMKLRTRICSMQTKVQTNISYDKT